jgi:hypothetical protein
MKVCKVPDPNTPPRCYHCRRSIKRLVTLSKNLLTYHPGCLRALKRRGVPERWL